LQLLWQIKKPLIERRRRERINECLGQLKSLVLEATNKDVCIAMFRIRLLTNFIFMKLMKTEVTFFQCLTVFKHNLVHIYN